jgi:hypothetical protein
MRRERSDHTLQPTALINEAYVRLLGQGTITFSNRVHFFGIAAQIMRQILVDFARRRVAAKRGSRLREELNEAIPYTRRWSVWHPSTIANAPFWEA